MYLLHGIMSGASEANLSLGLAVNVDSMRNILDIICREEGLACFAGGEVGF
jgi:hypothetical protein